VYLGEKNERSARDTHNNGRFQGRNRGRSVWGKKEQLGLPRHRKTGQEKSMQMEQKTVPHEKFGSTKRGGEGVASIFRRDQQKPYWAVKAVKGTLARPLAREQLKPAQKTALNVQWGKTKRPRPLERKNSNSGKSAPRNRALGRALLHSPRCPRHPGGRTTYEVRGKGKIYAIGTSED